MKTKLLQLILLLITCSRVDAQPGYLDSLADYQVKYKEGLEEIIQHDTAFVRFYPPDPSYRVIATVEKLNGQKFFDLGTSDGKPKQGIRYASVRFTLNGQEYTLYAYQLSSLLNSSEYRDNFFIPFTDGNSGLTSYGGGKYLDFVTSDITPDNKLILDFNRSYNPYCAFRPGYSCPIPPKENNLPVEIRAGEMSFSKK
jgi:uncharacterized protein (DUF1684 family)